MHIPKFCDVSSDLRRILEKPELQRGEAAPGDYVVELLGACRPHNPHRDYSYFLYGWDPDRNRYLRFGINDLKPEYRQADWWVRKAKVREAVRISVGNADAKEPPLKIQWFGGMEFMGPSRARVRELVMPLRDQDPMRIPFLIDQPGPAPYLMVIGLKPSTILDSADIGNRPDGLGSVDGLVDLLYFRRAFQFMVDTLEKPNLTNDLSAFQTWWGGMRPSDQVPALTVYSWLYSVPSRKGERAYLREDEALVEKLSNAKVVRELVNRYQPKLIVVHGQLAGRQLTPALRPLIEHDPSRYFPGLNPRLPEIAKGSFDKSERKFRFNVGYEAIVVPICDLAFFGQEKAASSELPMGYWEEFKEYLHRRMQSFQTSAKVAAIPAP